MIPTRDIADSIRNAGGIRHAGVHREAVHLGVELIGLPRAEHIQNVIDGLRTVADVLEVRGVGHARRRGERTGVLS